MLAMLGWPVSSIAYEAVAVSNGGAIVGAVKYAGDPPPPEKITVTKDEKVCGSEPKVSEALVVGPDKGIQNVVVSLTDIQKGKALQKPAQNPVLDQKNCEYHPHAQIFPAGATLDITNSDDVLHNVKTASVANPPVNIAQPKFKKKISQVFAKPEVIKVQCDVHGWMRAVLVSAEHPYYALTDAHGSYRIADVPPGKYTLKVWHETLGEQTKEVTVTAKEDTQAAFELKGK
jgi:plastocyanin